MANKDKKPVIKSQPPNAKQVRVEHSPGEFKHLRPSWQVSLLDFEGNMGMAAHDAKIRFSFSSDLLELVRDDDELFNAFDQMGGRGKFESLHQLTRHIQNAVSSMREIRVELLPELVKCARRYYFMDDIYPKLKSYETQTWHEIEKMVHGSKGKSKNHPIPVSNLKPYAKKRLKELGLDDLEELFSLRLDQNCRIYGKRVGACLQILWIDDGHDAYEFEE